MENNKQKNVQNPKNIKISSSNKGNNSKKIKNQNPIKVVYFSNPMKVKATEEEFRQIVQELTGRDSNITDAAAKFQSYAADGRSKSGSAEHKSITVTATDSNHVDYATISNYTISERSISRSDPVDNIGDHAQNSPYGNNFDAFDHQQDFNMEMLAMDKFSGGSLFSESPPCCEYLDGGTSNSAAQD